jgi:glyoxylate carboligase
LCGAAAELAKTIPCLLIQGPPCGYDRAAAIVAVSADMEFQFLRRPGGGLL